MHFTILRHHYQSNYVISGTGGFQIKPSLRVPFKTIENCNAGL